MNIVKIIKETMWEIVVKYPGGVGCKEVAGGRKTASFNVNDFTPKDVETNKLVPGAKFKELEFYQDTERGREHCVKLILQ